MTSYATSFSYYWYDSYLGKRAIGNGHIDTPSKSLQPCIDATIRHWHMCVDQHTTTTATTATTTAATTADCIVGSIITVMFIESLSTCFDGLTEHCDDSHRHVHRLEILK